MEARTALAIQAKIHSKQAIDQPVPDLDAAAGAVRDATSSHLKDDALRNVRNMALVTLGIGGGGAGLAGLYNLFKRQAGREKKRRLGPATLPMPYPVDTSMLPGLMAKSAGFMSGDLASSKGGIPWYGPAMVGTGLAGLGLGWKGVDMLLEQRRKREREKELTQARQEFNDSLMSMYDKPVVPGRKAAEDSPMRAAGQSLDEAFRYLVSCMTKQADLDWSNFGGRALGTYGTYAGLSGLLSGAIIYDQIQKRSRRAVIDKALQRRERRKFMQSPTEIYAIPEPAVKPPPLKTELSQLAKDDEP